MTVVDVNTGKFTGSGGNLEETVTKNNLEAAEEIVRQLRLRDIGGIIVVDFIDMVLESNRDLVLRRLVECLGRDRTRHQVAEVTSLGLVQMTRKRIGTGLLEAFSENCEHCQGRGVVIHDPVEPGSPPTTSRAVGRRGGGRGATATGRRRPRPPPRPQSGTVTEGHRRDGRAGPVDEEPRRGRPERQADGRDSTTTRGRARPELAATPRSRRDAGAVEAATRRPARRRAPATTKPPPVSAAHEPRRSRVAVTPRSEAAPAQVRRRGRHPPPDRPSGHRRPQPARRAGRGARAGRRSAAPRRQPPEIPGPRPRAARPRVVTRTRGRAASRPAGPPSAAAAPARSRPRPPGATSEPPSSARGRRSEPAVATRGRRRTSSTSRSRRRAPASAEPPASGAAPRFVLPRADVGSVVLTLGAFRRALSV